MTVTENRYLLRVWSEPGPDEELSWRATLRDVSNGKLATFVTMEELVKYLTSDLGANQQADDASG